MKTIYLTFAVAMFLLFGTLGTFAQSPQTFKYQAIARDLTGNVLANQNVSFRISILQTSATGTLVYSETHADTTNNFGLVNLEIGNGTSLNNFTTIDWGADIYFIKIEMDKTGGTAYQLMGTSQLLSVPYSLYAEKTGNVNDADADSTNEIQTLSVVGNNLTISSGNTVTLTDSVNDADADPTNELQAISISNDSVFLSNGGFVILPADQTVDADADPTNELQAISISNDSVFLSNGGFVTLPPDQTTDADADSTNELQAISISNDTIYLSNGGFAILPVDQTADADADSTNELQVLSFSNDTLFLSDGNYVVMPYDSAIWGRNSDTIYYNSGNISIGSPSPSPKAILHITSTTKGVLIPAMTTAQRLAIAPAIIDNGLMVYDTDTVSFYYWDSTQWIQIISGSNVSSEWLLFTADGF